MEETTLTIETSALLATLAGTLAGGRHAFRVKDAAVKDAATATAKLNRAARRKDAARKAYALKVKARVSRYMVGYTLDDMVRIDALFNVWQNAPKRKTVVAAFRARNHDVSTCEGCDACVEHITRPALIALLAAYKSARDDASAIGSFSVVNADMLMIRPERDSEGRVVKGNRFYGTAIKRWTTRYQGQTTIAGTSVEDALQDAYVSAIESGDTLNGIPTFGPLWRHVATAVTTAVWSHARYGAGHTSESFVPWDWTIEEPLTIEDWAAYGAFRETERANEEIHAAIRSERDARLAMLEASRNALASLILQGMTVRKIASILGRTVEGIESDVNGSQAPAQVWHGGALTPTAIETLAERNRAVAKHAETLRAIRVNVEADNYANGRIFAPANVPVAPLNRVNRYVAPPAGLNADQVHYRRTIGAVPFAWYGYRAA
jgi:DNA-directed RNA polymerase specialized sigma24 family protein